jgi:uncharacterized membrane protein YesL
MTEFEMAYLANDMMMALGTSTSILFTMLSAFLVASYVAAHRLTKPMAAIVVSIFVIFCFYTIATMFRQLESMAGLAGKMRAFAEAGKGLEWHAVSHVNPNWITTTRFVGVSILLLAMIASVYFFFHCRSVNQKAESGPRERETGNA